MEKHGYNFTEQAGLIATFLFRRLKACSSPEEVAKRICALCEAKPMAVEVEEKTRAALWECLVPVCAPSGCSVNKLEDAIELLKKTEDDELLRSFVTVSAGRLLRKDAEQVLIKRKASADIVVQILAFIEKSKPTLSLEQSTDKINAVRIYAERANALATLAETFDLEAVARRPFLSVSRHMVHDNASLIFFHSRSTRLFNSLNFSHSCVS